MWDELVWKQANSSDLKGRADEVFYFFRSLGNQSYRAHVFIAQYESSVQMKKGWEALNDEIAFLYQSKVNSLLERSNFYICLFIPEKIDGMEKAKIENDVYCAKKYVFENKTNSLEEKLQIIDKRIFKLECLEQEFHQETNLLSIEVENFRVYEGNKVFSFSAETDPQKPASLVMIYAPNGMGKTSVCDAIEWGLTGNVQRLKAIERMIGKGGMLLHNRTKYKSVKEYAVHGEYAWVKLRWRENNGNVEELTRTVKKYENDLQKGQITGNRERFNKELLWNQVIMPHDRIEEFIGATKPADRYKEWMDCIDPKKELRRGYEEENVVYLNAKKAYKAKEAELSDLKDKQDKLKEIGAVSKELEKNIKQYNEIAPRNLWFQVKGTNITIEEFLAVQTKAKSFATIVKNEESILKKKQSILDEYLDENGENFKLLNTEIERKQRECVKWDKNLKDWFAYEKLQIERNQIHKYNSQLKKELEIVQYILQQGETEMEEKNKRLYLIENQLPEKNQKLQDVSSKLVPVEKLLNEYRKKIEQLESTETKEENLISIAKKWKILTDKGNAAVELLDRRKIAERTTKDIQLQKQTAYTKILEYILPRTIEQYVEYQVPQDDCMFHYAGKLENLVQQKKQLENRSREYEKMIAEVRVAEQEVSKLVVEGRNFLKNHPSQCECPFCHTHFPNWNALYSATLKLENSQKTQLKKIEEQIEQERMEIVHSYENIYREWTNERILKTEQMSEFCSKANEKVKLAVSARQDAEKSVFEIEIQKKEKVEQAIQLGWDQTKELTSDNVEDTICKWKNRRTEEVKIALEQKTMLEVQKENLELEKKQCVQKIEELQLWKIEMENDVFYKKSILYLQNMLPDFDAIIKENELKKEIETQNEKEIKIQNEMLKYYTVSGIEKTFCEKKKENAEKELREIQKTYKELCTLVSTEKLSLNVLEKARKEVIGKWEYESKLLEKLGEIQYSGGLIESIEDYKNNEHKIGCLIEEINQKKCTVIKAKESVEREKKELLKKMDDYFRQPLFNEIYQKIDPHPYMKNVEYQIQYNEDKNEPELYINARMEEQDIYQPEWFFSTAQLNTVALSSFLSRALSLTELPIGMILIDDPVGHFDDMNILGFADLIRSILEKSEKQIIITTHDETVYQIFRRKIPPEKYKARFIDMTKE